MDLTLIAAASLVSSLGILWTILKVLIGLGLVIFVHELGHFLVAKACGVKCEKFYIGFDVPIKIGPIALPRTLGKAQWGETEYGIGIIPLGGYVKMLGQDDNPANAQAEAERIKIRRPEDNASTEPQPDSETESTGDTEFEWDPRSYPAKSVPQRMAIISAGVVMNLVFAVVFAAVAYRMGVKHEPCEIGRTIPGGPAWINNVETGTKVLQIGKDGAESEHLRFIWDLQQIIALGGMDDEQKPIDFQVRRPDGEQDWIQIQPSLRLKELGIYDFATIGVVPTICTTLATENEIHPQKAAAKCEPALKGNDRIIGVNGKLFDKSRANSMGDIPADELFSEFSDHISEPLVLTVERTEKTSEAGEQTRTLEVTIPPNPLITVGVRMGVGQIQAVRKGSPAAEAGFQVGDVIQTVDDQPVGDAMRLPKWVRDRAGTPIVFGVKRGKDGEQKVIQLTATPEARTGYNPDFGLGCLVPIEAIGVAFSVLNELTGVDPGSSADQAGLRQGDRIVSAKFTAPDDETKELAEQSFGSTYEVPVEFDDNQKSWPTVYTSLQSLPSAIQLELTVDRNGQEIVAKLESEVSSDEFFVIRGIRLTPMQRVHTAASWSEATSLGMRETKEKLFQVLDVLGKLVTFKLSPKNIGGPIMIAAAAGSEASQGIPRLLLFLTFLSANLAILNFLPIPALDGGHMLFLAVEGIIGKPVDERLQGTLTMIGVVALLALMIFVFANDINRFLF